jgi:hypothetical protein
MTWRHGVLGGMLVAVVAWLFVSGPIRQSPEYHGFADQRPWLGIPNALNVLSNLPFALAGFCGLAALSGVTPGPERRAYAVLFTGVALTAVGSSYYHLAPDNARLVWDRLPMTVAFMGLLAAVIADRVSADGSRRLLWPLLATGALSVVYWYWTERRGVGDLRPYALVQFGSLLTVLLLLLMYPARHSGTRYLVGGLLLYGGSKVLEAGDEALFAWGEVVSGHTLKHILAAAGVALLVPMLWGRARPRTRQTDG